MSKIKWWLLVFFSVGFVSAGLAGLLRLQFGSWWLPIILIMAGTYGLNVAIKQRKAPLSKLEWVLLVWFALAAVANAVRPLINSQ